ncbi:MAG: UDP-N-acetylmuramoyl-L-alanine--D-glutamate ligase [Proteobacteria bacterium]|nr:UDP-N-acetylmuramoyl-L-alanine--D-glutamate ligase [Pseudomonadota bacterium]
MNHNVIASNANSVVLGLGATGLSCARYLARCGKTFTVVDTRANPPGLEELLRDLPQVPVFLGEVPHAVVESAGELIVSPGLGLDQPLVKMAIKAGVEIVGDIDLFVREAAAPVIGITGSNAKSTVTELVGEMAREAGLNVAVGGNLGTPALDLLADDCELYVLELSSFQLERAGRLNLAVATVLNVSEDHLDRHGNLQTYHRVKHKIFSGCARAVVNKNDPLTTPLVAQSVGVISWRMGEPELGGFGLREEDGVEYLSYQFDRLLPVDDLGLLGRHNIANALAALAIGQSANLPMEAMLVALRTFSGLPHRCQAVGSIGGVSFVNDSKGTNPGATEAALKGLGNGRNILLIAGGVGKGANFEQLRSSVAAHCKLLVLIGESADEMQASLDRCVEICKADSLEQAVAIAMENAQAGDCILLSPACASFDMFSSYKDRGDTFIRAVAELQGGAS